MLGRRFLILFVTVALLPVLVFGIGVSVYLTSDRRTDVEARLWETARLASAAVDRQVGRDVAVLSTLSHFENPSDGDIDQFARGARRVLDDNRLWLGLALADKGGVRWQIRSVDPLRLPNFIRSDLVNEVLRTGRSVVSDVSLATTIGQFAFVSVLTPVEQDGVVHRVLGLAVPAATFQAPLSEAQSAAVPWLFLLDGANHIISCVGPGDACSTSRIATGAIGLSFGGDPGPGMAVNATLDGNRLLLIELPAPLSGWRVATAVPMAMIERVDRDIRLALAIGIAVALVIGMAVAGAVAYSLFRRNIAERRVAELEAEGESHRRQASMARSLPGLIFRRVLYTDGWTQLRCLADTDNVFHLPVSLNSDDVGCGEMLQRMMTQATASAWRRALEDSARSLRPLRLEGELVDPHGRTRRFSVHASIQRRADGVLVWDGVILDITDRHEAERARRLTADQLAFALEFADAGIWELDIPSNQCVWSASLWRLFGYPGPDGTPSLEKLERKLHPDDVDAFWTGIDGVLINGGDYAAEYRVIQPDGSIRWIASRARGTVDDSGRPIRVTALDIDITRIKRYQEALRAAKDEAERANVAKSRFLAAASHDLRQPVQSLMLFAYVLAQRLAPTTDAPLVGTMQQALDVLKELLDGILDLSRLDAGIIEPNPVDVPVAGFLNRLSAEYAPRFAAKQLKFKVYAGSGIMRVDPGLLGRIVGNLVENALKYTHQGGVLVGARRRGEGVRIDVWDTGIGIPENQIEEIFAEFVQLDNPERDRSRGLGLGLAIVKRLTGLLDYPLLARSIPGRGSVFAVTVPRLASALPVIAVGTEEREPDVSPIALAVVIDDERIILEGIRAMIESWGCEVVAAQTVADAIAQIETSGLRPKIAIADFRLADGQTGLDAIAALRARYDGDLPAILLTGDTSIDGAVAEAVPAVALAHKPVAPRELRRLMVRAMERVVEPV